VKEDSSVDYRDLRSYSFHDLRPGIGSWALLDAFAMADRHGRLREPGRLHSM